MSSDLHKTHFSPFTLIFRNKLIEEFNLLNLGNEEIDRKQKPTVGPRIPTAEPTVIQFQSPPDKVKFDDTIDRRRVRKEKCNAILESWAFQLLFDICLVADAVCIGVMAEIMTGNSEAWSWADLTFEVTEHAVLAVFFAEICLKWLVDFRGYWGNAWNVIDFVVIATSFLPEVLLLILTIIHVTKNYRSNMDYVIAGRSVRCVKILLRFPQTRLVLWAIGKSLKEVGKIVAMMLVFVFIFATIGANLLDTYEFTYTTTTISECFKDLLKAASTLFSLMTFGAWGDIFKGLTDVFGFWSVLIYVFLWIFIGSFIFQNVLVGIMVNRFQDLRKQIMIERTRGTTLSSKSSVNLSAPQRWDDEVDRISGRNQPAPEEILSQTEETEEQQSTSWDEFILHNVHTMSELPHQTTWPKDTLFSYYQLLEHLYENMAEREALIEHIGVAMQEILKE